MKKYYIIGFDGTRREVSKLWYFLEIKIFWKLLPFLIVTPIILLVSWLFISWLFLPLK